MDSQGDSEKTVFIGGGGPIPSSSSAVAVDVHAKPVLTRVAR